MVCLPPDTRSDAFITQLLAGDESAFRYLMDENHSLMLVVARAIVGDALAEDVVQDAWIAIHKALPQFEQRASLKTWLLTIVSNRAKTCLKQQSRYVSLADMDGDLPYYLSGQYFNDNGSWQRPPQPWGMNTPEAILEEADLRQCIEQSIRQLPPLQKSVFLLRDIEQLAFEDICNILQVSNSNVKVLLHRARLKLMEIITRYQEIGEC